MDVILFGIGAIAALVLLLVIAEPDRFLPSGDSKKDKVGSTYWGVYEGKPVVEAEENRTIELKKSKRKECVVAGSATYAAGRGVSMRGG